MPKTKQVYEIIRDINWAKYYPKTGPNAGVQVNVKNGSAIHKITEGTAMALAIEFKRGNPNIVPLPYALACAALESAMDPSAINRNLQFGNSQSDPDNYDIGVCQLNIHWLRTDPDAPVEIQTDINAATAFAYNYTSAIKWFYGQKALLLQTADQTKFGPNADRRSTNRYWVASTFYNMGRTGGLNAINNGTVNDYGAKVAAFEVQIAGWLGVDSLMAGVL